MAEPPAETGCLLNGRDSVRGRSGGLAGEHVAAAVFRMSWRRRGARELGDNQAFIAMASNPASSSRTKHMDISDHLEWECVEQGEVRLVHVPTAKLPAGGMTNALPALAFRDFRAAEGVFDLHG